MWSIHRSPDPKSHDYKGCRPPCISVFLYTIILCLVKSVLNRIDGNLLTINVFHYAFKSVEATVQPLSKDYSREGKPNAQIALNAIAIRSPFGRSDQHGVLEPRPSHCVSLSTRKSKKKKEKRDDFLILDYVSSFTSLGTESISYQPVLHASTVESGHTLLKTPSTYCEASWSSILSPFKFYDQALASELDGLYLLYARILDSFFYKKNQSINQ